MIMSRLALPLLVVLLASPAASPALVQKNRPAPDVEIGWVAPPAMRPGDETTTDITVRALADLDTVDLSFVPFPGVEIVQVPETRRYRGVTKGRVIRVSVRVRLTASGGRIAVGCESWIGSSRVYQSAEILYGETRDGNDGVGR
jgi:hypothetical protein